MGGAVKAGARIAKDAKEGGASFEDGIMLGNMIRTGELSLDDLEHTGYDPKGGWVSQEPVGESADARLLRLAGVTKEAVEAARPTKRLADIDGNVVTSKPVGAIHKKW